MPTVNILGYAALQHVEHGLTDGSIHYLHAYSPTAVKIGQTQHSTAWHSTAEFDSTAQTP